MPYKDKEKLKEYQRNWNHTKKGVANRQLRRDARKELVEELILNGFNLFFGDVLTAL